MPEPIATISLVTSVISLIEFSIKVTARFREYNNRTKGLPKMFKDLEVNLPLILDVLKRIQNHAESGKLLDETREVLVPVILGAKEKIERLYEIFEKVVPSPTDSKLAKNLKAAVSLKYEGTVKSNTAALQEHLAVLVLHASSHATSSEPETQREPVFMMPFERDSDFLDRKDVMQQVEERLVRLNRVVLAGMGGVGKSQVAIEYCYRYQAANPESHVFWIHMGTLSTARNAFSQIARRLAIPGWDRQDKEVDALQLVGEYLSSKRHSPWLLVLDDTDDADVLFSVEGVTKPSAQAKSLASYLPRNKNGKILVTTRDRRVGETLSKDGLLDIDIPVLSDALLLLQSKLHKDRWDEALAKELVTNLGYLPLAVAQAAAFINQNNINIEEYLRCLRAGDAGIKELLQLELYDLRRYDTAQVSVLHTLKLSFNLIEKQEPRAMSILSLMAVLHYQMVPKSLLCKSEESPVEFIIAIGKLQAFSLVTAVRGGEMFSMHPLVHLAARAQLEHGRNVVKYQEEALSLLDNDFPDPDLENWETCGALLPHFQAIYDFVPLDDTLRLRKVRLTQAIAKFDLQWYRYVEAWQKLEHCLTLREPIAGNASPTLAAVWNDIGRVKHLWGDAHAAEVAFQRAYDLCTESVTTNFDICISLLGISSSKKGQGDYLGAKEFLQEALDVQFPALGEDHELTLIMQLELAELARQCGEYDYGEVIEHRVLASRDTKLGTKGLTTKDCLFQPASTLSQKGKHFEAELASREDSLGDSHPYTLRTLSAVGAYLSKQGRHEESEVLFRQHMARTVHLWGNDSLEASQSVQQLATALSSQGKFEEAERLLSNAIDTSSRTLGTEHPETLNIKADLADVYRCQEKNVEAGALLRHVLPLRERILGLGNFMTQNTMISLAGVFTQTKDYSSALEMCRRLLEPQEPPLSAHYRLALWYMGIASICLWKLGHLDEATTMLRKDLKAREETRGLEDKGTLECMKDLARCLAKQDQLQEAVELFERASSLYKKTLGPEHDTTLRCVALMTEARTKLQDSHATTL